MADGMNSISNGLSRSALNIRYKKRRDELEEAENSMKEQVSHGRSIAEHVKNQLDDVLNLLFKNEREQSIDKTHPLTTSFQQLPGSSFSLSSLCDWCDLDTARLLQRQEDEFNGLQIRHERQRQLQKESHDIMRHQTAAYVEEAIGRGPVLSSERLLLQKQQLEMHFFERQQTFVHQNLELQRLHERHCAEKLRSERRSSGQPASGSGSGQGPNPGAGPEPGPEQGPKDGFSCNASFYPSYDGRSQPPSGTTPTPDSLFSFNASFQQRCASIADGIRCFANLQSDPFTESLLGVSEVVKPELARVVKDDSVPVNENESAPNLEQPSISLGYSSNPESADPWSFGLASSSHIRDTRPGRIPSSPANPQKGNPDTIALVKELEGRLCVSGSVLN